ncbi:competence protein ComEC [Aquiflexum balticum DSM 16537]|uniref:Competence protein ComEC n=1 Tax=Aquiflexum balticum DSM 16537 TaxID=758820 RepID=A0A1W2GYC0_9BACT|nr:ComEC/Rec2 family competence protein [Aquiflexum balticum]SMD41611.1 competence protein ComEC [Aquiflexum balticum DSM 16537]
MRFSEFPFLRYLVFFIIGILIYPYTSLISVRTIIFAILSCYILYLICIILNIKRRSFGFKSLLPWTAYVILILCGYFFSYQRDIRNQPFHLINTASEIKSYLGVVMSLDEPKTNSIANRVSVKKVYDGEMMLETEGEVLVYHKSEKQLWPGDLIWISGSPQLIQKPKNPKEFDYSLFMLRQQISHQHFIGDNFERIGRVSERPIEDFFISIRSRVMNSMDKFFSDQNSNQIAKALLLGQKKNLEKEVSEAYVTAGAMHILAVSGLHVGIIYGFFFLFVKPFRLPVTKRVIYLSAIILLIWCYALLTGMSPSVMRAATMFSLMALAQMKSRSPSIFNAIALSAMILLVYDPFLIYAVGFQLSYLALLGIIIIQPLLVRIWIPKNKFFEYAWQITTVGLAAQLATFPISAYYFHVFPSYFILSNLIAIPGAFLIMSFGVPFMVFAEVPFLGQWLSWVTDKLIFSVNAVIFWIQDLPYSRISEISLSSFSIFIYWVMLILMIVLWVNPGKKPAIAFLLFLIFFGVIRILNSIEDKNRQELLFYSIDKGLAVDFISGNNLFYLDDASSADISYKVQPNRTALGAKALYPLKVLQKENQVKIPMPDPGLDIDLLGRSISFSSLDKTGSIYEWNTIKWEQIIPKDTLSIDGNALKVRFK